MKITMNLMMFIVSGVLIAACNDEKKLPEGGALATETVCTADVKQCPDGQTVSRDPKNQCEFPECPEANTLQEDTK